MPVRFSGPREAEDSGIRIIYQELNLVPQLTVADNIFLGREKTWGGRLGWLDNRAMEDRSRNLFARLGTLIDPSAKLGDLRIGDQQMVEIAKALAFDAAVVIMDEPTSALSDSEVERLFRVIADLRKAGTSVLYISHKMNEVFTLADQVTVLRDGQFVATASRAETSPEKVVRWMVGREIAALNYVQHPIGEQPLLEVLDLSLPTPAGSGRPSLRDISFSVRTGEVAGSRRLARCRANRIAGSHLWSERLSTGWNDPNRRDAKSGLHIPIRRSRRGSPWSRKTAKLSDSSIA